MSEEMLELADAGKRHAEGLTAQLDNPNWTPRRAHIEQARNSIEKLAALLRASAVAEPVAYTSAAQLGFLQLKRFAGVPMAMWASHSGADDVALYTHPAPAAPVPNLQGKLAGSSAAPVPASIREALEKIAKQATSAEMREVIAKECAKFEDARSWHASAGLADFEGGYDECVRVARTALASLPVPEAAPTREETIEQCATIATGWGCQPEGRAAILALKAAPSK